MQDKIQDKIRAQIKEAMLAKDAERLNVLRGILTAFTNELVAKGKKPQDILSDEDALAVIRKLSKQRKDSIEQFEKGGRADLADVEKGELKILESYLPQMMSKDEIKKVAEAKKTEMGLTGLSAEAGKSKLGIFMGAVMKELKGKADGADVKEVIESLF